MIQVKAIGSIKSTVRLPAVGALEAWHGQDENQLAKVLRASCNGAASLGKYTEGMELETASADKPARRHDWRDD